MKNAKYIPFVVIVTLSLLSCYNPALPENPFVCGAGGKCPDGYTCYGGICLTASPVCMDSTHPDYLGWQHDQALEPNNHPTLAVVLPCGDEAAASNPVEYATRCPNRQNYTNGFSHLMICPDGDRDFYAVYVLPDEAVTFKVLHMYNSAPPRDLDARVWTWNYIKDDWRDDVVVGGASTNDQEEVTFNTMEGSNNSQGWYYLEVYGKTDLDLNIYTVSYTLNASPIANP